MKSFRGMSACAGASCSGLKLEPSYKVDPAPPAKFGMASFYRIIIPVAFFVLFIFFIFVIFRIDLPIPTRMAPLMK